MPSRELTLIKLMYRCWFVTLFAVFAGCMACRNPPPQPLACCPEPPVHTLPLVGFEDRAPIQLALLEGPHRGVPFTDSQRSSLRDLTIEQCERLAAAASPTAEQLRRERAVLCRLGNVPSSFIRMLDAQIEQERSDSAGQAMKAYLNLVEVHLQHELILESYQLLDDAKNTVMKLRSEQVTVRHDDGEFLRKRLDLDERAQQLRYRQAQLTSQLEALLQLDDSQLEPLWTNYQSRSETAPLDVAAELETAWQNRGDLTALDALAQGDASAELLEFLRATARSVHPLMGIAARRIGPLASERSRDQNAAESSERSCQIASIAKQKRELAEFEIEDAVASTAMHLQVMSYKRQAIASVDSSIEAAERAKDLEPIDFATDLERRLQRLELRSDWIHEIIAFESDLIRLRKVQGLLGRNSLSCDIAQSDTTLEPSAIVARPVVGLSGDSDRIVPRWLGGRNPPPE